MAKKFGLTWWGEKFLNSLTHIDNNNRLPRGRTYARNSYVKSIDFKDNRIEAKVKGSMRTPYRVEIVVPKLIQAEKDALLKVIYQEPLILASLLNRELPEEIYVIANELNIDLFPLRWNDFSMDCSCPDYAVPCKHLAAVIYLISEEIDRDPFRLFSLKGLDIQKELKREGLNLTKERSIPCMSNIYSSKQYKYKVQEKEDRNALDMDLSSLTKQSKNILSLLDNQTVFFEKKFLSLMQKQYRSVEKYATTILNKEVTMFEPMEFEDIYSTLVWINDNSLFHSAMMQSDRGVVEFNVLDDGIYGMMNFLDRIPRKYLSRLSTSLQTLYQCYHLSLKLAASGAYIPQILDMRGIKHVVRWIPATINPEVHAFIEILASNLTEDLVRVLEEGTKVHYLSAYDQVMAMASQFLTYFVSENRPIEVKSLKSTDAKVVNMFFYGEPQSFDALHEKQIPESIHQYLHLLFLSSNQFVPIVKVQDNPNKHQFEFELWVEDQKNGIGKPLPLSTFLEDKQYETFKPSLLKTLSSLTNEFKDLKTLVTSKKDQKLIYKADGFMDFMTYVLPWVRLLNIRVMLPASLKDLARPQLSMKITSQLESSNTKSYLSLDSVLDFEWQIAIGDTTVSISEFRKMVQNMSGIIKLRENYIMVDPKEIAKLLDNINTEKKVSKADILQSALSESYDGATVTLTDEVRMLIKETTTPKDVEIPNTLDATLRPYQERGFQWLYNNTKIGFGSIIADDMGLGKTIQIITLLLKLKEEKQLDKHKAIIVVPTTLITNWSKELERFAPSLSYQIYHGTKRELDVSAADITITSYGVMRSDIEKLSKVKWAIAAIDEAQNIKNAGTHQTKAIKKLKANSKIAMSGTPVENRLKEYWSIFDFVNKGYLGSATAFQKNFSKPIELENNHQQLEVFKMVTKPFILRRTKMDKSIISDLPDKVEHNCYTQLTADQTALYEGVIKEAKDSRDDTDSAFKRAGLILKMMTALKQICNHPSQFLKKGDSNIALSGKAAHLISLLTSIMESNEKVLIFTQYKEMGDLLTQMIEQELRQTPLFLHGGTPRKSRDQMVEDFQNKPHVKIFILSIKAGGTGLNLTAANHVVHYDLWWNPAVEAQATDRAFRIGQKKNVMVHRMITKDTFEEKIDKMIQSKKALADLTVTQGEKWIGELTNQELDELVRISKE
ncbi:DEAD/DEAH box helicase [Halosquirtibacter xylanolyticus]|uniref:DEAD/DEAH box helicase n=1 Tax=Halosquirtibacter xylanolyticus TaxID=3374599 RepID=UPI003748A587|nr:DEAD/DEAH box helicase [Prolixibacteraceae bacterium]